jgi:uroporphyrinogen decarboxylase
MTKKELFMANIRREHTSRVPIWIMRQAGRYLPEYRDFRKNMTFEALCKNPKAVAEVTAQPIEILNLDAAIIFSDILLILEPLGVNLTFDPGPIISPYLEEGRQVAGYHGFDPAVKMDFVGKALVETRKRIGNDIPLLGFCGAPFTVLCYLCGTKGAKDFYKTVRFLTNYPKEGEKVLELLTKVSVSYLKMQLNSGADAVQIFDTWAGELSQDEFMSWSYPYLKTIFDELKKDGAVTSIYIKNSYHLLEKMANINADIVSLDWRVPLKEAREIFPNKTLQGNLDPHLLLAPKETVIKRAAEILNEAKDFPGFIFNLGHGILPETPVENVKALVSTVHNFER